MDVHRPAHGRIRCFGVHDIEQDVNHFIAGDAQDRCAEDRFRLRVDEDLHEALSLTLLDCSADVGHGASGDQRLAPGSSYLRFGHAGAAERRIDEKRVGR